MKSDEGLFWKSTASSASSATHNICIISLLELITNKGNDPDTKCGPYRNWNLLQADWKFAYLRNKKKTNKTVSCLRKDNGQSTTCPKETADLLVESFASVFTKEKARNENCVLENVAKQINEFTVDREEVVQQLNSLNTH